MECSLQPSHQRSRSIHSIAFGAIALCPDVHKCSLWRGAAAGSIMSGLQHALATCSCSPGRLRRFRGSTRTGARPRRPPCHAQPGDAPATSLLAGSEREAERFGSTLEKHLGSLFILTQGDDALRSPGSRTFWARMLEPAKACTGARLSAQAVCAQVCVHGRTWAAEYTCVWVGSGDSTCLCLHTYVYSRMCLANNRRSLICTALPMPWARLPG